MNNYYVYYLIDPETSQPFYVGKGTGRRMYEHHRVRNRLKNPILKNKLCKLHNDGNKVIYEKVLINAPENTAFSKERELIAKHGKKIDGTGILCNLTDGGEGNSSSWSEDRRKVRSEQMKGARGNLPLKRRSVSQYSLDGEFITLWSSIKAASENTPANQSYITQVCKGKRKSAGGFLWTYQGDPKPTMNKRLWKGVQQLSLDGEMLDEFQSLTEAQRETGVKLHNISECCRGNSKTAGGFNWVYL